MPGKHPDRIKDLALYDGRFAAHRLRAADCDVETDEIEFRFKP